VSDAEAGAGPKPFAGPAQNHRAALFYYMAGVGLLSLLDACIKDVATRYPTFEVAFLRYSAGVFVIGAVVAYVRPGWPSRQLIVVNGIRSGLAALLAVTFFFSLSALPLAEAVALSFISPAFMALFGTLILKEALARRVGVALAVGFLGVLVIIGGKLGQSTYGPLAIWGALAALVSAVVYALSLVLLRARAQHDPVVSIVLVLHVGAAALLALPALLVWRTPAPADTLIFAATGVFGTGGHLLIANAFARSQAGRLAPFEYTALIWAAGLGYLIFAEIPGLATILGALFIGASAWIARRD